MAAPAMCCRTVDESSRTRAFGLFKNLHKTGKYSSTTSFDDPKATRFANRMNPSTIGKRLSGFALSLSKRGAPTTSSQAVAVMLSRMDRHSFASPIVATGSVFNAIVTNKSQSVVSAKTKEGIPRDDSFALAISAKMSAPLPPSCRLQSSTIFPFEHFFSNAHRLRHSCLRTSASSFSFTIATQYSRAILWLENFPAHLNTSWSASTLRFSASSDSSSVAFSTRLSRSSSETLSGRDDAKSLIRSMRDMPPALPSTD
mmetsp:Transcript_6466/g.18501  ORF Transcript_6466/g.18501 Transcript_6466/m.18501 type:complete len:257 (+) Transcript_6466:7655-8425(+)